GQVRDPRVPARGRRRAVRVRAAPVGVRLHRRVGVARQPDDGVRRAPARALRFAHRRARRAVHAAARCRLQRRDAARVAGRVLVSRRELLALMALRVALVGGPMYDGLYSFLPADVDMVVHADHPTLNRQVAEMLAAGERIDLLATHSKYAPSQAAWLRPLDELVPADVLTTLAPDAVGLCRFEDSLLCVPRNIDVRVLWWRTDVLDAAPDTWADLAASGQPFGFPGRESGLFGTFFELVVSHGGRLFDDDVRPTMTGPEAVAAVETLCALAANAPD